MRSFSMGWVLIVLYSLLPLSKGWADSIVEPRDSGASVLLQNTHEVHVMGLGKRSFLAAGSGSFAALWTRDFAFAALGALGAGDVDPVREGLEILLHFQRSDGMIPRRIDGVSNLWRGFAKRFGIHLKPAKILKHAEFKSGLGGIPIDSNALIAWLAEEYWLKTGDAGFLRKNWSKLVLAFDWLQTQEAEGLLNQTPFADWKDVTRRQGKVFYSNVVYYRGLKAMSAIARELQLIEEATNYARKAEGLKELLRAKFWSQGLGYFVDYLGDTSGRLSSDGNLFAILFGLASESESQLILESCERLLWNSQVGLYASLSEPYPKKMVPLSVRWVGIRGYGDNSFLYPWNTALVAMAYRHLDSSSARAEELVGHLELLVQKVGFQEVLEKSGKPVSRWAHSSEPDFSWFAGFLLLAESSQLKIIEPAPLEE